MSIFNIEKIKQLNAHIIFLIFVILGGGWMLYEKASLKLNKKITVGFISDPGRGHKTNLVYEFCIDGNNYSGIVPMGDYTELMPGDSVLIKYDSTRPSNNEAIIYFRQELVKDSLPDTVYRRQYCNVFGKKIKLKKTN